MINKEGLFTFTAVTTVVRKRLEGESNADFSLGKNVSGFAKVKPVIKFTWL